MNLRQPVPMLALACFLPSLAGCGEGGDAIPKDFQVVADFGVSSFTDPRDSWRATITRDGHVIRGIYKDRPEPRWTTRPLAKADLKALRDAIAEADFFSLPGAISARITDATNLIVTVTEGGRTHEVKIYGVSELGDDPRVRRFLKVWRVLHRIVPSPNQDSEGGSSGFIGPGA